MNAFFQWRYDTTLVFVRVTPPSPRAAWRSPCRWACSPGLLASWTLLRRPVLDLLRR